MIRYRNAVGRCGTALLGLLLFFFALASIAATTATAATTLLVMMTISGGCTVNTTASNMQLLPSVTAMTGMLNIACNHPTPYNVGLGPGGGAGATTMARWMTGPGGALARYGLFQDAALTANFGSTVGADTVPGIGSAAAQTITVYGKIPDPASLNAGAYVDVVTVTVTF